MKQNAISDNTEENVQRMLCLIFGMIHAQAITAAAELGIPDLLRDTPRTLDEISAATAANKASLQRVLQMLELLDVLKVNDNGCYTITEMGSLLQRDNPHSLFNYTRLTNCDTVSQVATRMLQGIKTGESQFDALFAADFYQTLQQRPDEAEKFAGAMEDIARQDNLVSATITDFNWQGTVIDIGGGGGQFLAWILANNTDASGVLYELPAVAGQTDPALQEYIDNKRCQVIAGNFLEQVPADGDIYILKRVLSHCTDTDAARLLRNIRGSIRTGASLLIADPDPSSLYGSSFDVLMLILLGGGLRNGEQLASLLKTGGFTYNRILVSSASLTITEALAGTT